MGKYVVCLSFDFDALSLWLARGMTLPTSLSRGEFGVVGARRILTLLSDHGITATWFIPGHTIETYPEVVGTILESGHEVAHHGYLHETPAQLTEEEEEAVLVRGIEVIQKISGKAPRGYRSPAWELSPHTVDLLVRYGFRYDSSLMGNDYTPYLARTGDVVQTGGPVQFGRSTPLVELPIHWSLDDFPYFEYLRAGNYVQPGLQPASTALENWLGDFTYLQEVQDEGVLTFTFHPQVIGRGHRMLALRRLIDELTRRGATFARMEDVALHWQGLLRPSA